MSICLRRREFIAGLGVAAVAWPLYASAQRPAIPFIGYLSAGPPSAEFRRRLEEAGYDEGRNVALTHLPPIWSAGGWP
jgi:hypothetical protein